MFDAFKERDLAGALEGVEHDIEAEPSSAFPGQEVYRGHEGVLRFFAMFFEAGMSTTPNRLSSSMRETT